MPFVHGRSAQVLFNAVDLSPYLNSAELGLSVSTGDTTTFGSTWTSALAGLGSATLSAGGFYDVVLTAPIDALRVDNGVLTFCPGGGSAIGSKARLLLVTGTAYGESAPVDDVVALSWEAMSEGVVAFGDILHPLGLDTNTTTGASRDDAAATATGWTAHLHVTLVGGGTWTIALEDSADGSAWAAVSGGSFSALAAVGSQRLASAGTTTALRRYVRYVATRSGGIAGNGITFAVAYARTKA